MQLAHSTKKMLEQYHTESFGWAMCCCNRDREIAADVLQSVYLKILEGKARFKGKSEFRTWLFAIIRNTAFDWYRKEKRRNNWLNRQPSEPLWEDPLHGEIVQTEMQILIEKAFKKLSPRQHEVLHLVFYHEMTIEEAASVVKMPVGTARTHYERGKKNLRCWLGKRKEELL